jgi:hypothetical protein
VGLEHENIKVSAICAVICRYGNSSPPPPPPPPCQPGLSDRLAVELGSENVRAAMVAIISDRRGSGERGDGRWCSEDVVSTMGGQWVVREGRKRAAIDGGRPN